MLHFTSHKMLAANSHLFKEKKQALEEKQKQRQDGLKITSPPICQLLSATVRTVGYLTRVKSCRPQEERAKLKERTEAYEKDSYGNVHGIRHPQHVTCPTFAKVLVSW